MLAAYSVADVRLAEQATGRLLLDGTLMERAATAIAAYGAGLLYAVYGARVVLLVGRGDNGGDALYAGALLAARGARVDAVLLASAAHEGGLVALTRAGGRAVAVDDARAPELLAGAELVVDGITGIGGRGGLRAPAIALLHHLPESAVVLAVDVPSGVDADTGEVEGAAVQAHLTLTFGVAKPGLLVAPGATHAGRVVVVDLGLGPFLGEAPTVESWDDHDVAHTLRRPRPTDDKYARGVVGIAAGSDAYTGAGVLAVAGAVGVGAGMVRFVSTPSVADLVRARHPEVVVSALAPGDPLGDAGRVQAWVVGPGGGTDTDAVALVRAALESDVPVVVDADGLTVLAGDAAIADLVRRRAAPTVLTPHAGELGRLLGVDRAAVEAARLHHVRLAAGTFGATVLLKGSTTLVATDGATTRANPTAVPWLATAGSGDVLSGVVGALLSAGLAAHDAASVGAWLHAAAGEAAAQGGPLRAGAVAEALPGVVASLLEPHRGGDSPS